MQAATFEFSIKILEKIPSLQENPAVLMTFNLFD